MALHCDSLESFVCVCTLYYHNIASKTTPKVVFICNLLCQWLYCYFRRQHIHFLLRGLPELSSIEHCFAFALALSLRLSLYFISRLLDSLVIVFGAFISLKIPPTTANGSLFLSLSFFPAKSEFMFVVLLWIMFCNIKWMYLMYERIYLFIYFGCVNLNVCVYGKEENGSCRSRCYCKMYSVSPSKW